MLTLKEKRQHGRVDFPVEVYNSKWFVPYQWHNEEEIIFMIDGSAYFNINGKTILLNSGDCAYCRGKELHSMMLEPGQAVNFYALLFDLSYVFGAGDACGKYLSGVRIKDFFSPGVVKEREAIEIVKNICSLMLQRGEGHEIHVKAQLMQLFSTFLKNDMYSENEIKAPRYDKNITAIINHIHANFSQKLTVAQLAGMAGYSKSYFEYLFKLYTGKTTVEYIILFRLQMAENALTETDKSVLDISIACGFPNVSYFIRTFKRYYFDTPNRYRQARSYNHASATHHTSPKRH
ncbi:MAG: AraC family transcriptional regulator [Defluviitaleaceae bacterium]|nr:AraC family transcriptional regulator [Defluviitaleaceae bacterium]